MRIAINGFGRLGRAIARAALGKGAEQGIEQDIEIVGINDVANAENLAYLLEKDSMHGALGQSVRLKQGSLYNTLIIEQKCQEALQDLSTKQAHKAPLARREIPLFSCANPLDLDFGALGAEVVIESSGLFLRSSDVAHHLDKGVRRVIISAPATDDTPTFVLGVNHTAYAGQPIISNASCTTNCLAPIAMLLEREFGIERASLTTIHSYTNDQSLLDVAHASDKRRSRAAGLNIIPTSTGAAKALYKVLPSLKDKIHGHSVRVPVADVSMVDLSAYLSQKVDSRAINELFAAESQGALQGILGIDSCYGVSSDFLNDTRSAIIAQDLSFTLGNMCKVMAWYDNEWGYAHRIIDIAHYVLAR
ncbi:type I glyceraldehyde-3-phosphate dehydrogenase [Helicobacter canis]|uniref:Glyceraldehyde 3-phosphate dehydrogenase n=1 Tax=Helicobacter canis TaxID=29419 RepID=A0A377J4K6_9HELI|nr:type I glyceraldehyde-3-phosphate dehydrogenase [Helicobacter canis]STO96733.1 glyceraldehyde 3-phosphate dehydrogenase [Helicobacter canis]